MIDNPRLFGIVHSNRNFKKQDSWGKNVFNSSFPAALIAYLYSRNIKSVYLKTNENNLVFHDYIDGEDLYGINPIGDNTFYAFESVFTPYQPFYIGTTPRIDLVTHQRDNGKCLRGLEIKLTALPDNATCEECSEDLFSCELVIRPDTISYIACSIAKYYLNKREFLGDILNDLRKIDWEDDDDILLQYNLIVESLEKLNKIHYPYQEPIVLEPVWKTFGKSPILADHCLDSFVWSNLALTHLFANFSYCPIKKIGRMERTVVWLMKMLWDFVVYGQFDADLIIDHYSFNTKNDKAFSANGKITYPYLQCGELTQPRINKNEIKNIILGGGQNLLSPERRFDAIIFNSPDLFK